MPGYLLSVAGLGGLFTGSRFEGFQARKDLLYSFQWAVFLFMQQNNLFLDGLVSQHDA